MNFYVNSQGQIIRVDPEDVFQGSVNANTINFIGAFPSTCPVTVAFRLPTGEWTTPASMGMNSDSPLPGIQQPDGTQFNIWRYAIPGTVTEYYGTVNLQFYVYAQGSSGNGNTIATASSSFEVKKGVPVVLPDPSDDYETLLTQILSALQQLQQADSEGALSAQQSAEAAANSASAAASSATAAEAAQTAAEAAQSKAETAAGSAATSATAAQTAQAAAEAAQTAAETAQSGAEQAKDDAQDLVNEVQNVVNNFVQTGGPFTNGITVDKQIALRGNPTSDTSESVLQHKEYGFNFYDVEEGTDLSGKSLFFDTENSPLEDSNFNGTSLEPLISFQNGCTLYVNPNVSPSNYSVYMSTPSGGISYFYLNGQWIADVYTFTGSGWVVSSVEKENFENDAAQILADMITVGTFFVPSRTRFDEGAQIPLTPGGAFDVANKQYVDDTVKTEAGYLQQAIDNEASARAAADTALRNSKYDKTGGTIDGNVQITGDLTVQGTTTTNDTETLAVKDNLIVTNSDGATLSGLSGLIIRTSPTQSYGIVYDPANEGTVKLGLGTYNAETGAFTFATGEGLPVAIRALSTAWTNLHLAAWDAASNQFIDAGKAVADFQEKLTFDTTPTQNSTNPVTSGGVKSYVDNVASNIEEQIPPAITVDSALSSTSENPVQNKVVNEAIDVVSETATNAFNIADNIISGDQTAYKAYRDGSGNNIEDTYAKKTEIPAEYTLPVADSDTLGGVKPVAKTSEMTQDVGVDSDGALYTKPAPPVDSNPTSGSDNPVSSGGVYSALQGKQNTLTAGDGISIDDGVISATGTEIQWATDAEIEALFN